MKQGMLTVISQAGFGMRMPMLSVIALCRVMGMKPMVSITPISVSLDCRLKTMQLVPILDFQMTSLGHLSHWGWTMQVALQVVSAFHHHVQGSATCQDQAEWPLQRTTITQPASRLLVQVHKLQRLAGLHQKTGIPSSHQTISCAINQPAIFRLQTSAVNSMA